MHAPDEVLVDPNNPQVAGPFIQGVDPAVDGLNEEVQTSKRTTIGRRFQSPDGDGQGAQDPSEGWEEEQKDEESHHLRGPPCFARRLEIHHQADIFDVKHDEKSNHLDKGQQRAEEGSNPMREWG